MIVNINNTRVYFELNKYVCTTNDDDVSLYTTYKNQQTKITHEKIV